MTDIAQRNERAQKQARRVRAAREQEQARRRRQDDLRYSDPPDAPADRY